MIEGTIYKGIEKLRKEPKTLIVEEVNKCKDPLNLFNSLNTIYRKTGCPVVIVSNKITLMNDMPEDAKKTLLFDKIDFPPYNALELKDIIESRLKKIKEHQKIPTIPKGAIERICAIGGRESSARIVLDMTLKCLLYNDFSDKSINEQWKKIQDEDWREFLEKLTTTEITFLKVMRDLYVNNQGTFSTSDIAGKMPNISPSRISQLVTTFEDYGVITTNTKNMGRAGGIFRTISFVSKDMFKRLDSLIGY